ncbi:hypothetical protein KIN20_013709 [Parelaphostrongylus tenuis]|uniref:Uncharacterized protein n=1 Tax=Parelaphostrongylus tenuis TaxID=148309 RepID=A0AAD5QNR5_PARTN|nr:hypothetical protein KIN20_013709 [Parelaphostrongylus tenuis]
MYGFRIFEHDGYSDFAKAIDAHKPYTAPHPYFSMWTSSVTRGSLLELVTLNQAFSLAMKLFDVP